jgi:hypothetical protein
MGTLKSYPSQQKAVWQFPPLTQEALEAKPPPNPNGRGVQPTSSSPW